MGRVLNLGLSRLQEEINLIYGSRLVSLVLKSTCHAFLIPVEKAGSQGRGKLSTDSEVRGTFETDPIGALGLPPLVSVTTQATVGHALSAVQEHGQGYVLICDEDGRPRGMMSQREVLMRIVARDVKYDSNVMEFVSKIPVTLTNKERIARAIKVMISEGIDIIPVVDDTGKATAVVRSVDVLHFLAEVFPEQLLNLPPEPHQTMPKPEGG